MKIHPLFDAMGGLYILIFTFISFLLKSKFQVRIIMKTNLKERIFGANESIFSFIQFKHTNKILKNNLEKKIGTKMSAFSFGTKVSGIKMSGTKLSGAKLSGIPDDYISHTKLGKSENLN